VWHDFVPLVASVTNRFGDQLRALRGKRALPFPAAGNRDPLDVLSYSLAGDARALVRGHGLGVLKCAVRTEHVAALGRPPAMTPEQQAEARRRRAQGATLAELARSYHVGKSTISRLTSTRLPYGHPFHEQRLSRRPKIAVLLSLWRGVSVRGHYKS
jgi:Helix-turn-helix domain of resolvase